MKNYLLLLSFFFIAGCHCIKQVQNSSVKNDFCKETIQNVVADKWSHTDTLFSVSDSIVDIFNFGGNEMGLYGDCFIKLDTTDIKKILGSPNYNSNNLRFDYYLSEGCLLNNSCKKISIYFNELGKVRCSFVTIGLSIE